MGVLLQASYSMIQSAMPRASRSRWSGDAPAENRVIPELPLRPTTLVAWNRELLRRA